MTVAGDSSGVTMPGLIAMWVPITQGRRGVLANLTHGPRHAACISGARHPPAAVVDRHSDSSNTRVHH
jgi:hypothetical protein